MPGLMKGRGGKKKTRKKIVALHRIEPGSTDTNGFRPDTQKLVSGTQPRVWVIASLILWNAGSNRSVHNE